MATRLEYRFVHIKFLMASRPTRLIFTGYKESIAGSSSRERYGRELEFIGMQDPYEIH